jgi:lysophospholipase L1-like esterase
MRHGKASAAIALALLWALLAPAAPTGATPPAALKARPRVLVIGDSLAVGTKPYLPRELHNWHVRQSTRLSRNVPQGVAILRRVKRPADVIVISLGTNDDPHLVSRFRDGVRSILNLAGEKRCVVWPNIVRPPVGGASYAAFNRILTHLDHRPNLRVLDWVDMVRHNHQWLGEDGVHVTATGYMARARAIAREVRACGRAQSG